MDTFYLWLDGKEDEKDRTVLARKEVGWRKEVGRSLRLFPSTEK